MNLELVGQVVVPGVVAFGTAFGFFLARARAAGALEQRVKSTEAHVGDEKVHCAPEHHERLARIEERVDGIKEGLEGLGERMEKAFSRRRAPARRR